MHPGVAAHVQKEPNLAAASYGPTPSRPSVSLALGGLAAPACHDTEVETSGPGTPSMRLGKGKKTFRSSVRPTVTKKRDALEMLIQATESGQRNVQQWVADEGGCASEHGHSVGRKAGGSVRCRGTTGGQRAAGSGCSLQQGQDNPANGSGRDKPRRHAGCEWKLSSGASANSEYRCAGYRKKGRDIAMEMGSEGCVFKNDHSFPASSGKWAWTWLTASGFRYRRGKCKRRTPIPVVRAVMARWWSVVREFVVFQEDRFGRPVRLVNIDQTAVAFVQELDSTYGDGNERNRGTVPNPSMRMRMATLQVLLCNDPSVPPCPPTIIFKETGGAEGRERSQYDPRVKVLWQRNAWMDTNLCLQRIQNVYKPWVNAAYPDRELIVLWDSATHQRDSDVIRKMKKLRSVPLFGPKNMTEHWQPLDASGVNSIFKALPRVIMEQWLEESADNEEKWVCWESLRKRAARAAHLVGQAWQELVGDKCKTHVAKAFTTTGTWNAFDHSRKSPCGRVVVSAPRL